MQDSIVDQVSVFKRYLYYVSRPRRSAAGAVSTKACWNPYSTEGLILVDGRFCEPPAQDPSVNQQQPQKDRCHPPQVLCE